MKNKKLHQWLWKWHFIAGIVSLPFVVILSITGGIYLFNPKVTQKTKKSLQVNIAKKKEVISYQKQWEIVKNYLGKSPSAILISPKTTNTEFTSGRFSHKKSFFVNPHNGAILGEFSPKNTWMYTVRKLHGELLGGKVGTKIIELIASWMVVLILTGLYIWWPFKKGVKGALIIRLNQGKKLFYRDLHAVTSFWIASLLLITIAGGLPWTDVFGSGYKWIQKTTDTGFPKTWFGKGLFSTNNNKKSLTLDEMITIAKKHKLKGNIALGLPLSPNSTFSVSNKTFDFDALKMLHFDQYSGKLVKEHNWRDIGILMQVRLWVMAFHQGQLGSLNWWTMFSMCVFLTIASIAAILSYFSRKKKGSWNIPKSPINFSIAPFIIVIIGILGILLPLFGVSLFIIMILNTFFSKNKC